MYNIDFIKGHRYKRRLFVGMMGPIGGESASDWAMDEYD